MFEQDTPSVGSKPKRWWKKYLPATLIIASLISLGALALRYGTFDTDDSLPKSHEIVSMTIEQWFDGSNVQSYTTMPGFEVPENHWDKILTALSPYEDEGEPRTAWVILAFGEIKTAKRRYRLTLYDTFSSVGAFAVNTRDYRGGFNVKLKQTLEDAYIEAERRKGNTTVSFPKIRTTQDVLEKLNAKAMKGTQQAVFKNRDDARKYLGSPDQVYTQDQVPLEVWAYCCADGNQLFSIIEEAATKATGRQILVYPTKLQEFRPKSLRM